MLLIYLCALCTGTTQQYNIFIIIKLCIEGAGSECYGRIRKFIARGHYL